MQGAACCRCEVRMDAESDLGTHANECRQFHTRIAVSNQTDGPNIMESCKIDQHIFRKRTESNIAVI